ncbi:MAG: DUF2269 family protein [Mailhella sp.]|nr:DUF2269 family protein [Mailhella sp.]
MKLTGKSQKLVKSLHIFAACCWLGTAMSLVLLSLGKYMGWIPAKAFFGVDYAAHLADQWVLVNIGVLLCFITGLIYSLFTEWGFFRHRWIIVKWIALIACVAFGTWLGTLESSLLRLSTELGANAAASQEYLAILKQHLGGGVAQVIAVIAMVVISVFKPWKRQKANK